MDEIDKLKQLKQTITQSEAIYPRITTVPPDDEKHLSIRKDDFKMDSRTTTYLNIFEEYCLSVHEGENPKEAFEKLEKEWPTETVNRKLAYDLLPEEVQDEVPENFDFEGER